MITGGPRGLGVGIVEAFVACGSIVTVVARNEFQLNQVRERLEGNTICADITFSDDAGAHAYAKAMSPRECGDMVSVSLTDEKYKQEFAFTINGQNGIQVLQPASYMSHGHSGRAVLLSCFLLG